MNLAPEGYKITWRAKDMKRTYIVTLTEEERLHLEKITSSGTLPARTLKRAQILLKSDME